MGLLGIDPQRTVAHTHHGQRLSFLGRIEELPTQRTPGARWLRAETSLFCYRTEPEDSRWTAMPGDAERIWLYIDTTRRASPQEVDPQRLGVGDIVEFRGRIYSSLEGDSTGYNRYMLRTRGVTGRCYTWRVERVEQDSTRFAARVARLRDRLNSRLKTDNEQTTSIIQALAIGRQQAVDQELRRSYSRTGLAHLLSVSGLHVGIVFAILKLGISQIIGCRFCIFFAVAG